MDIDVFPREDLETVFRVLRTALSPADALQPAERLFLDTYSRITGYDLPADDPAPMEQLVVHIDGAHQCKRLVQLAALAVLLSQPPKPGSVAFLKALAHHLGIDDPVIDIIEALAQGRHFKVRALVMRRVLAAMMLTAPINQDQLRNYKRLGLLPEESLGREYWKHMTRQGFGFPGDVAGIPHSIAYHDVAHLLADNDTTPLGEIQQGSFQGGNRREDGFFFIQRVILQFDQGVKVTPVPEGHVGHFHPEKVLWAINRGAQCAVDVTYQWDYWPLMSLPLHEARAQCGLLPKLPATA